jgi:release factor glutamine methyltransferase
LTVNAAQTISRALHRGIHFLTGSVPLPALEARVLLEFATGLEHTALLRDSERTLSPDEAQRYDDALERRRCGEPVAYITGEREFWSLPLKVTEDTLIPRADTELLVEQALTHIPADVDWCIADLGTGSGAVALAIAGERPRCKIIATDTSIEALDVAKVNADRLQIDNIDFRYGSWFDPIDNGECKVVVSNPPYVCSDDPHLESGDVAHEPRHALVAGADGMDDIRTIISGATLCLARGGWLLLEHGFDQGGPVREELRQASFREIGSLRDLAGLERVTQACRPGQ